MFRSASGISQGRSDDRHKQPRLRVAGESTSVSRAVGDLNVREWRRGQMCEDRQWKKDK